MECDISVSCPSGRGVLYLKVGREEVQDHVRWLA